MTYAAVGSIQGNNGSPVPSLSLTTTTIGNFVVAEVINTGTATATALSSSNCTWTALGAPFTGVTNAGTCQCFLGAVTATGAATVSITWGAGTHTTFSGISAQEFSSTSGTPVLDTQGHIDSAGTNTWASLPPAAAGEAYFGYALNAGSATNGSTSGYTYGNDGAGNGVAHNAACGAGATAPVWGDSGQQLGVMVLVAPAPGAGLPPPPRYAQPGLTWERQFRRPGFFQQQPPGPVTAQANPVTASASGAALNASVITVSAAAAPTFYPGPTWRKHFQWPQQQQLSGPPPRAFGDAQTATATGTAGAVAASPKYITGIAGAGTAQYFTDGNHQPIAVRGDSIWGLITNAGYRGGATTYQTDIDLYFSTRAAQGFNAAVVDVTTTTTEGLVNITFANGNTWDNVSPWASGVVGNLNATYWQRVDYAITSAAANGITVFLVLADWHCFGGSNAFDAMSGAQATTYGTALAARYAASPNIVWLFGNDYNDGQVTVYQNIFAALRAGGDTHLATIENLTEGDSRFSAQAGTAYTWGTANAQINFVYTYAGCYPAINYAYQEPSPLPVLLGDGWYDGTGFSTIPAAERDFMRGLVWWSLSSGSRGYIYGDESLISWNPPTRLTTSVFASTDLNNIWNAYTSWAGWHQLVPDTGNVLVTGGRGTPLGLEAADTSVSYTGEAGDFGGAPNYYVTASITADHSLAVLYLPDATGTQNGGPVVINQSLLGAGYTANWVDPATGVQTPTTTGSTYSNGTANSQGRADWVLLLQGPPVLAPVGGQAQPGLTWRRRFLHQQQPVPPAPAPAAVTNATAGLAAASVVALGQDNGSDLASVAPNAAAAAATGTSLGQDAGADIASVLPNAGLVTGTGTARGFDTGDALPGVAYPPVQAYPGQPWRKYFQHPQQPVPPAPFDVYPATALASGTSLGQDTGANIADVLPNAGNAAATGAALGQDTGSDLASVTVNAGLAAATGSAANASTALPAAAAPAAYPGGVWRHHFQHPQQPATFTAPPAFTSVNAGLAAATGTALGQDAGADIATVSPNAAPATGTGTGQSAAASLADTGGSAAATGTGQNPGAAVATTPGAAAGTGAALDAGVSAVSAPPLLQVLPGRTWLRQFRHLQQPLPPLPFVAPTFQVARSTATVTDPRDGTASVLAGTTSSPTVS